MASRITQPVIVIRCDASTAVGFGHAVRSLAVADACRATGGAEVVFAMRDDRDGKALIERRGYAVVTQPATASEDAWLEEIVASRDAAVLLLDARTGLRASTVNTIRKRGVLAVTIDDSSDRRLATDLAFYPPVPQVARLAWPGFTGERRVGWEWVPLRADVATARSRAVESRFTSSQRTLLVTMGASDPAGLTMLALSALELIDGDLRIRVMIGPAFMHRPTLERKLSMTRIQYEILTDHSDFLGSAVDAALAITSFGVTAYELAAVGVPAIHLCLTDDHAESASALEAAGASLNLGVHGRVTPPDLARAIETLLHDDAALTRMSQRGRDTFDGEGAARIADAILSRFTARPNHPAAH